MSLGTGLVVALMFFAISAYVVIPTAPREPLGREVARGLPLSLVIGLVLAWVVSI